MEIGRKQRAGREKERMETQYIFSATVMFLSVINIFVISVLIVILP